MGRSGGKRTSEAATSRPITNGDQSSSDWLWAASARMPACAEYLGVRGAHPGSAFPLARFTSGWRGRGPMELCAIVDSLRQALDGYLSSLGARAAAWERCVCLWRHCPRPRPRCAVIAAAATASSIPGRFATIAAHHSRSASF